METIPFKIDPEILEATSDISNEELEVLVELQEDPHGDSQIELYAYLCYVLFKRSNTLEKLDLATHKIRELVAATPKDHIDMSRRLQISDMLSLQKLEFEKEIGVDVVESELRTLEIGNHTTENQSEHFGDPRSGAANFTGQQQYDYTGIASEASGDRQTAVACLPAPGHPERIGALHNLGSLLMGKYEAQTDIKILNDAILAFRDLVNEAPTGDMRKARGMDNLAQLLNSRFRQLKHIQDSNEALKIAKIALDHRPLDETARGQILRTIALLYCTRFNILGMLDDLCDAIRSSNAALAMTPETHLSHSIAKDFRVLVFKLGQKAEELSLNTLKEMIGIAEGEKKCGINEKDGSNESGALGILLFTRFKKSTNPKYEDIDRAIGIAEEALRLPGVRFYDPRSILWKIQEYFQELYDTSKFDEYLPPEILERGIKANELIAEYINYEQHSDMWAYVQWSLCAKLRIRAKRNSSIEEQERAIEINDLLLGLGAEIHTERAELFSELGKICASVWDENQESKYMDRAVAAHEISLNSTDAGSLKRGFRLATLGIILGDRYKTTNEPDDLNRAIELLTESLDYLRQLNNETAIARALLHLGNDISMRFERTGAMEDLELAIQMIEASLQLQAPDEPIRALAFAFLGNFILLRYERTRDNDHLNDAIGKLHQALRPDATPLALKIGLHFLGIGYSKRYYSTGASEDLDNAVQYMTRSIEVTQNVMELSMKIYHVGEFQLYRFISSGDMKYLDNSIENLESALALNISNPNERNIILRYLADLLTLKQQFAKDERGLERVEFLLKDAMATRSRPSYRIRAAKSLALKFVHQSKWEDAYTVIKDAIDLFPILSSRTMRNTDKQASVEEFFGLASMAAAIALNAGKEPFAALMLLEQGRGVVSGLVMEMRSDISQLEAQDSNLAKEFISLRDKMDTCDPPLTFTSANTASDFESKNKRRQETERRFNELIDEIRVLRGLERFLLPPTENQLVSAAGSHFIAVINVHRYRCDAFLVQKEGIRIVPLPNLNPDKIDQKIALLRENKGMAGWKVLEWLWEVVCCPIFDCIDIKMASPQYGSPGSPQPSELPHFWWVPTGKLSQLPLHAAGRHFAGTRETVLDMAISSYALSIKTLLYSRQHLSRKSGIPGSAVLISMPNTIRQPALPYVEKEINVVEELCKGLELNPLRPTTTQKEVLSHLQGCEIFHFAGHGRSDPSNPSKSCLLLEDWEASPLTVENLWDQKLQDDSPFLAYLSACSTGQTRRLNFMDEGIHLIGAFQIAGFRHVVGTLWEVNDSYCETVAKVVYETLKEAGITDGAIALGLHRALVLLRNKSVKGKFKSAPHREIGEGDSKTGMELDPFIATIMDTVDGKLTDTFGDEAKVALTDWNRPQFDGSDSSNIFTGNANLYSNLPPEIVTKIVSAPVELVKISLITRKSPVNLYSQSKGLTAQRNGGSDADIQAGLPTTVGSSNDESHENADLSMEGGRTATPIKLQQRMVPNLFWIPYVHFGV
ncbi:hypothetical protein TWF694_010197 [Orbilia ellipsospora]|uniref:CHAT domain-containing protein n=1 Tax=Orbilia ellipsospora TaxID=2528407 RepID=A0AAV9XBT6_9PEZI